MKDMAMQGRQEVTIFESIPDFFLDYSLGGYSHWEHWSHARRICNYQSYEARIGAKYRLPY
jgi:hypothetical protein